MSSSDRIAALEAELAELIAYMKRLPVVPATAERVQKAQELLDDKAESLPLQGSIYTPAGYLITSVSIADDKATIKTELPEPEAARLLGALTNGITLKLSRVSLPKTWKNP